MDRLSIDIDIPGQVYIVINLDQLTIFIL